MDDPTKIRNASVTLFMFVLRWPLVETDTSGGSSGAERNHGSKSQSSIFRAGVIDSTGAGEWDGFC
jgi:hypothetical protein